MVDGDGARDDVQIKIPRGCVPPLVLAILVGVCIINLVILLLYHALYYPYVPVIGQDIVEKVLGLTFDVSALLAYLAAMGWIAGWGRSRK